MCLGGDGRFWRGRIQHRRQLVVGDRVTLWVEPVTPATMTTPTGGGTVVVPETVQTVGATPSRRPTTSSPSSRPSPLTGRVDGNDATNGSTTVRWEVVTGTSHGKVTLDTNSPFVYQPDPKYFGSDQFTYRMVDASGRESIATVSVNVAQLPSPVVSTLVSGSAPDHVLTEGSGVTGQSVTINAPAGVASISLAGTTVSLAALQGLGTQPVVIDTGRGVITLTGFDAATGTLRYDYSAKVLTHTGGQPSATADPWWSPMATARPAATTVVSIADSRPGPGMMRRR